MPVAITTSPPGHNPRSSGDEPGAGEVVSSALLAGHLSPPVLGRKIGCRPSDRLHLPACFHRRGAQAVETRVDTARLDVEQAASRLLSVDVGVSRHLPVSCRNCGLMPDPLLEPSALSSDHLLASEFCK